jgi:hypothetical protein
MLVYLRLSWKVRIAIDRRQRRLDLGEKFREPGLVGLQLQSINFRERLADRR